MTSVSTMETTLNQPIVPVTFPMMIPSFIVSYDPWAGHGSTLVLLPLLMVVGVPGNILVLLVYSWRFPASTFREFVRVLAWLDLACNLVAMPLHITSILVTNDPGITVAARYVSYATLSASAVVLVVIAVDRYLKVCQPQRTGITIVRARLLCVLGILLAFLVNILTCFSYNGNYATTTALVAHMALTGGFFLACTLSMVVLYSLVWHRLRSHARRMRESSSGGEAVSAVESTNRQALRTSKIFSAVTVLFFLSILPHFLFSIIILVEPRILIDATPVGSVCLVLAYDSPYINSVANPFVYSFTLPRFRKELWDMLQGPRPGTPPPRRPSTVTAARSDPARRDPGSSRTSRETSKECVVTSL